jgi:hypothetical protein
MRTWTLGAVVSLMLLTVACSPDNGDDSSTKADRAAKPKPAPSTTSTTTPAEPTGDKPWAVKPYLEKLLQRYDAVANEIVADPAVAKDRSNATVQEFLRLFERGSDFASRSLDDWARMAEDGITLKPLSSAHPVLQTYVDGSVVPDQEDHVSFAQCEIQRWVKYQNGKEVRRVDGPALLLPGNGTAVRVEGHWRLSDLTTPPGTKGCSKGAGGAG